MTDMEEKSDAYNTFQYGSSWLCADFHLHTRADKEFTYLGEDNSFLNDYIAKLKQENIQIAAVTNHNKFARDEFINLRKKARKEEIFLLPGVELSVAEGASGIHTLIIFSDDWIKDGKDFINQMLGVVFQGKVPQEYEQENGRTTVNLLQTIEKLDDYNMDYFIIFAHVEQGSGLWKELNGGRIIELGKNAFIRERTLGFQKVRTIDKQDEVCKKKVIDWLGWYPAEVEGSDCKSLQDIGSKEEKCFLKVGDFTFSAVKYALSDHENRCRKDILPKYNHSHLKSISFEGGIFDGEMINFSPELVALIGIRGSGKSAILESLRYALDLPLNDRALNIKYKKDLVPYTLGSGGKITITAVDQYGQQYEIKRILNELPEVYVQGKIQPGISINETIIKKPIYFGQEDLSSSSTGFENDLVEKLIADSLYEIRKKIEAQKIKLNDSISLFQKLINVDEQIDEYKQRKQDAEYRLNRFKDSDIEEKLQKQTNFDKDERRVCVIIEKAQNYISDFEVFISEHEDEMKNLMLYNSVENKEFFIDFLKTYDAFINSINQQKIEIETLNIAVSQLNDKQKSFSQKKKAVLDEFAEIRRKLETELTGAINLEEYPNLKTEIDVAIQNIATLEKHKIQRDNIKNELLTCISELNNLWHDEFNLIKKRLDEINSKNDSLKIESEFKGDKISFKTYMKAMFQGSELRETNISQLVDCFSDFGAMFRDMATAKQKTGTSSDIFEQYFMRSISSLLSYQVANKFTIKYKGKELQHHSLGQRASALILFVLSQQDNDLVIIDQPEDDLDNQTIYNDVIKLIRELKPNHQFIFATHNANIPVLGDAEQICVCKYYDNKVQTNIGSIDSNEIQKDIIDIMEGGRDAFEQRKKVYNIWKHQN